MIRRSKSPTSRTTVRIRKKKTIQINSDILENDSLINFSNEEDHSESNNNYIDMYFVLLLEFTSRNISQFDRIYETTGEIFTEGV